MEDGACSEERRGITLTRKGREAVSLKDLKMSSREDKRIGAVHNSIFFSKPPNSPAQYSSPSGSAELSMGALCGTSLSPQR